VIGQIDIDFVDEILYNEFAPFGLPPSGRGVHLIMQPFKANGA
jgi:hypothetical protein